MDPRRQADEALAQTPCMLDIMGVKRILPHSCFSDEQIELLFTYYRRYIKGLLTVADAATGGGTPMTEEAANQFVEQNVANRSLGDMYTTMQLGTKGLPVSAPWATGWTDGTWPSSERAWVMQDLPTNNKFLQWVRLQPGLMETLRMSFKPALLSHKDGLDQDDIKAVMRRYQHWLQSDRERSLRVLGLYDLSLEDATQAVKGLVQVMSTEWSSYRYHLTLVTHDYGQWVAILVDRTHHSLEVYDPQSHIMELMSTHEDRRWFRVVREIWAHLPGEDWTFKQVSSVRGAEVHQRGRRECGMFIILYVHSRIALKMTFEEFVRTKMHDGHCTALRSFFFDLSVPPPVAAAFSTADRTRSTDFSWEFPLDVRLTAKTFFDYVVTDYTRRRNPTFSTNAALRQLQGILGTSADWAMVQEAALALQDDFLMRLNPEVRTFMGTDLWFSLAREITDDPWVQVLRRSGSKTHQRSGQSASSAETPPPKGQKKKKKQQTKKPKSGGKTSDRRRPPTFQASYVQHQLLEVWADLNRWHESEPDALRRSAWEYVCRARFEELLVVFKFSDRLYGRFVLLRGLTFPRCIERLFHEINSRELVSAGVFYLRWVEARLRDPTPFQIPVQSGTVVNVQLGYHVDTLMNRQYPVVMRLPQPSDFPGIQQRMQTCTATLTRAQQLIALIKARLAQPGAALLPPSAAFSGSQRFVTPAPVASAVPSAARTAAAPTPVAPAAASAPAANETPEYWQKWDQSGMMLLRHGTFLANNSLKDSLCPVFTTLSDQALRQMSTTTYAVAIILGTHIKILEYIRRSIADAAAYAPLPFYAEAVSSLISLVQSSAVKYMRREFTNAAYDLLAEYQDVLNSTANQTARVFQLDLLVTNELIKAVSQGQSQGRLQTPEGVTMRAQVQQWFGALDQ